MVAVACGVILAGDYVALGRTVIGGSHRGSTCQRNRTKRKQLLRVHACRARGSSVTNCPCCFPCLRADFCGKAGGMQEKSSHDREKFPSVHSRFAGFVAGPLAGPGCRRWPLSPRETVKLSAKEEQAINHAEQGDIGRADRIIPTVGGVKAGQRAQTANKSEERRGG